MMPVMTAAGYVPMTPRSHRGDGTLFTLPAEPNQPPKKKAKVQHPPHQPLGALQRPAPVAPQPQPPVFLPPLASPPQGLPQGQPWPPTQHPTMPSVTPAAWPPQGAATQVPGVPGGRMGGY